MANQKIKTIQINSPKSIYPYRNLKTEISTEDSRIYSTLLYYLLMHRASLLGYFKNDEKGPRLLEKETPTSLRNSDRDNIIIQLLGIITVIRVHTIVDSQELIQYPVVLARYRRYLVQLGHENVRSCANFSPKNMSCRTKDPEF